MATVTGFAGCLKLSFQWDGEDLPSKTVTNVSDERLGMDLEVPISASTGSHNVTASCDGDKPTPPATFTVDSKPDPTLALSPTKGLPGTRFTAMVAGFDPCTDMTFRWDGDPLPPLRHGPADIGGT